MNNKIKSIFTLLLSLCLCFIILEVILRIYNPFPTRIKADKITLPVNRKYIYENDRIDGLDKKIVHTKNSLGFRGAEPPKDFDNYLSIITVGGSSTECFYLSDDKTWPYLLEQKLKKSYNNIWLNNAGLDGHSTFGHKILLQDYLIKLKPEIVLFLIGPNDIGRNDLNLYDKSTLRGEYESWKNFIVRNSEVASLFVNILRVLDARKRQLAHKNLDIVKLGNLKVSEKMINTELQRHKEKYLESYKKRILNLVDISRANQIVPILITQPVLVGKGIDSSTGVNLETIKLSKSLNGKLYWEVLQLYNNITKEVGKTIDIPVIDLANKLPKNSLYFYDNYHLTNKGAEEVSEILYRELKNYLDNKYRFFKHRL